MVSASFRRFDISHHKSAGPLRHDAGGDDIHETEPEIMIHFQGMAQVFNCLENNQDLRRPDQRPMSRHIGVLCPATISPPGL